MNYYLLEKEQVFNELKNNIYKNLHELETISNSYNLKFFRLNNNIIITSKLREDYYHIMIILNNYDDEFPYNLSQFAKDQYIQKYILSVNYENELNVNHFNFLKFIYACNSYVNLKQRDNIFINCIKELTEDDKAIVDLCNFQEIKNRPSFSFLYETFVINKEGRIFAYIKDSKIIGYLSIMYT